MTAPTGEQIEIVCGEQRAVIVELGGGLRTYEAAGRALLDGYAADEMCPSGRGQVLIPWPNRIEDGSYEFDGRSNQLALNEADRRNAIHGLVRWVPWVIAERLEDRVALRHVLHPQPGYPYLLAVEMTYTLTADGLAVRTRATNIGAIRCPYGAGAHPYLMLGEPPVDGLHLRVPARTVLEADARGIPTGSSPVADGAYDFRSPRPIGGAILDHAFTDLDCDDDGLARVVLEDPEAGARLTVWVDDAYGYLMLFTGDPLPDVARRSLAIEPMTCPPNAFRSGEAVISLEPGESYTSAWGISPS